MEKKQKEYIHILKTLLILLIIVIFLHLLNKSSQRPYLNVSKQDSAVNFSNNFLQLFSLGNKRLLSSLLWVQTLLESDIEHYKKKDLNSWIYLRLKTIIALDPLFYHAYRYGGQYLSIIKDDIIGASDIYEKGLIQYPEDFWLNFHAGFHYYFEAQNIDRAIELYKKIQFHSFAYKYVHFLPSLVTKMILTKEGDLSNAYKLMLTAYNNAPKDGPMRQKFFSYLYSIKAEIDLKCLNSKESDRHFKCDKTDFNGNRYIRTTSGKFIAQRNWSPFKLFKRKKGNQ